MHRRHYGQNLRHDAKIIIFRPVQVQRKKDNMINVLRFGLLGVSLYFLLRRR